MQEDNGLSVGGAVGTFPDIDAALAGSLNTVLRNGHHLGTLNSRTGEVEGNTECIACNFIINNPLDRILFNPVRRFNVVNAVGRFTLMMAKTDRVEHFAFYDDRVRLYTDDNLVVPGSNYGKRLLHFGEAGIDQIKGVIAKLSEPGSRRGTAAIYSAADAVRDSRDIPCALSVHFMIRDNKLVTVTSMRSNNVYALVPHNVFEFTMLAEIIARTLKVDLGPYIHFSNSLHVFDKDKERAQQVIGGLSAIKYRYAMDPMPSQPAPLTQVMRLASLEEQLHYRSIGNRESDYAALLSEAKDLNDYWLALYKVLLLNFFRRNGNLALAEEIAIELPSYFRRPILPELALLSSPGTSTESKKDHKQQLSLEGKPVTSTFDRVKKQLTQAPDERAKSFIEFEDFCYDNKVIRPEVKALYKKCIIDIPVAVAARKTSTLRERLEAELKTIRRLD